MPGGPVSSGLNMNASEAEVIQCEIASEIMLERCRQNAQWGGADHDDTHGAMDWARYLDYQLCKISAYPDPETRRRYVKIAALAMAAIESLDRLPK